MKATFTPRPIDTYIQAADPLLQELNALAHYASIYLSGPRSNDTTKNLCQSGVLLELEHTIRQLRDLHFRSFEIFCAEQEETRRDGISSETLFGTPSHK